jgi:hypothetical protein
MEMTFWLPQAKAALAEVEGRQWASMAFRGWDVPLDGPAAGSCGVFGAC